MAGRVINDELANWPDISKNFRTDNKAVHDVGLLLGNGASQAVWKRFSYPSLYELACDPSREFSLAPAQQAIFTEMKTTNFENVLWSLATAKMVCKFLGKPYKDIEEHYHLIRLSLIHSVSDVHIPYGNVTDVVKDRLMKTFRYFDYVYTTNYDLLLYWVVMNDDKQFKDFLWYNMFNPADAHVWGNVTKVIFLHGALHLYHDVTGNTIKKENDDFQGDILSQFYGDPDLIPLFVSEGDWSDKLRSIRRNDYLSFAYWKLACHRGPMVVFGNSLSEKFDKHILDAMKNWKRYDRGRLGPAPSPRKVAISMYRGMSSSEIVAEKNRLCAELSDCELYFFDSATHALGDQRLLLKPAVSS